VLQSLPENGVKRSHVSTVSSLHIGGIRPARQRRERPEHLLVRSEFRRRDAPGHRVASGVQQGEGEEGGRGVGAEAAFRPTASAVTIGRGLRRGQPRAIQRDLLMDLLSLASFLNVPKKESESFGRSTGQKLVY